MKNVFLSLILVFGLIQTIAAAEPYAVLTGRKTQKTLTFYYGTRPSDAIIVAKHYTKGEERVWNPDTINIHTVVFDSSFAECCLTSTAHWFCNLKNLTAIKGVENINTSMVTDMSWMFDDCSKLESLDVSNFDTHNVTDMSGMFGGCSKLKSLDLSNFNTSNVTDMAAMFYECSGLKSLDLSNFNTSNVTDMESMFDNSPGLEKICVGAGWNMKNVKKHDDMFRKCKNLRGGNGTVFNKSHVDGSYAKIDNGKNNPGYFTKSPQ